MSSVKAGASRSRKQQILISYLVSSRESSATPRDSCAASIGTDPDKCHCALATGLTADPVAFPR